MLRKFATSVWFPFVVAVLLVSGMIILSDVPERDVLGRYAPMAEAFFKGDWILVFHPRIPLLFPVIGGIFTYFVNGDGYLACQLAASAAFVFTVFPLWGIFKRVFEPRTALWGTVLFVLCSYLLRFASAGGRDSTKMFFFITAVYAMICVWQEREKLRWYLLAGISAAAMAMVRDDSLLVAFAAFAAVLGFEISGTKKFPWRTLSASAAGFVLLLPLLWVNYIYTGYPVPSIRFVPYAMEVMPGWVFGGEALDAVAVSYAPQPSLPAAETAPVSTGADAVSAGAEVLSDEEFNWSTLPDEVLPDHMTLPPFAPKRFIDFGVSLLKGSYYYFALPALLFCLLQFRRRRWTAEQSILFYTFAGHTLLIVLQVLASDGYLYVSRRYLIAAAPLLMGWTALAFNELKDLIFRRIPGKYAGVLWYACCTVGVFVLLYNTASPQLKKRFRTRQSFDRETVLLWAEDIRRDYKGPAERDLRAMRLEYYMSFRRPVVVGDLLPELGYLSGGEGFATTYTDALARGIVPDYMVVAHPAGVPGGPVIPDGYAIWRKAGDKRGDLLLLKNKELP